jgi:anti-anti-sigma factor
MSCKSHLDKDTDTLTFSIVGYFDHQVRPQFSDLLTTTHKHYIIDFAEASAIDSAALGMLLMLKERADDQNASLTLHNASGKILRVFEISNFDKIFQLTSDQ